MIYNQCFILVKKIVTTPVVDVTLILKTILRKKLFIYLLFRDGSYHVILALSQTLGPKQSSFHSLLSSWQLQEGAATLPVL